VYHAHLGYDENRVTTHFLKAAELNKIKKSKVFSSWFCFPLWYSYTRVWFVVYAKNFLFKTAFSNEDNFGETAAVEAFHLITLDPSVFSPLPP